MLIPSVADPGKTGRLPTLQDRGWRYAVFFSLYAYQGLVAGFSLTALANHYAALGLSTTEVGLHFAIAGLPWTVQPILWGPLVDRALTVRMGRRRIWIVLAIVGCLAALLGLLIVPGAEALGAVGLVFFLHSVFASLLDTACDRMIMDHVPATELGRMSACTRSGFVVGTSIAAAVFAWTLSAWGFPASVRLLLGLALAATVLPLLVRERPEDQLLSRRVVKSVGVPLPDVRFRAFLKRLAVGLKRPAALRMLALCFGIDFALALFEVPFGVSLIQEHGWDGTALSRLQAGLALVGGTLGAVAIGSWSDRAGPRRALISLLLMSGAAFAGASLLLATGLVGLAGPLVLGLTNVLPNLIIVALVPMLMRTSRSRPGAATEFEVFMAVMNIGSVAGTAVAGFVVLWMPLWSIGLFAAAMLIAGVPLSRSETESLDGVA